MPSEARLKNFEINILFILIITVKYFPCVTEKYFPCVSKFFAVSKQNSVFSLSGKSNNQIPCFPCAVATLSFVRIFVYSVYEILRLTEAGQIKIIARPVIKSSSQKVLLKTVEGSRQGFTSWT